MISVTGLDSAARVIVRDRKSTTVVAEHCVQDFAHRHNRPVDRAFRHGDDPLNMVRSVAYDDYHSLTASMSELATRNRGEVLSGPQLDRMVASASPAELKGGHERSGLCQTYPWSGREFFQSRASQGPG